MLNTTTKAGTGTFVLAAGAARSWLQFRRFRLPHGRLGIAGHLANAFSVAAVLAVVASPVARSAVPVMPAPQTAVAVPASPAAQKAAPAVPAGQKAAPVAPAVQKAAPAVPVPQKAVPAPARPAFPSPDPLLHALDRLARAVDASADGDLFELTTLYQKLSTELERAAATFASAAKAAGESPPVRFMPTVRSYGQRGEDLLKLAAARRVSMVNYSSHFEQLDTRVKKWLDHARNNSGRVVARQSLVKLTGDLDDLRGRYAEFVSADTIDSSTSDVLGASEGVLAQTLTRDRASFTRVDGQGWYGKSLADLQAMSAARKVLLQIDRQRKTGARRFGDDSDALSRIVEQMGKTETYDARQSGPLGASGVAVASGAAAGATSVDGRGGVPLATAAADTHWGTPIAAAGADTHRGALTAAPGGGALANVPVAATSADARLGASTGAAGANARGGLPTAPTGADARLGASTASAGAGAGAGARGDLLTTPTGADARLRASTTAAGADARGGLPPAATGADARLGASTTTGGAGAFGGVQIAATRADARLGTSTAAAGADAHGGMPIAAAGANTAQGAPLAAAGTDMGPGVSTIAASDERGMASATADADTRRDVPLSTAGTETREGVSLAADTSAAASNAASPPSDEGVQRSVTTTATLEPPKHSRTVLVAWLSVGMLLLVVCISAATVLSIVHPVRRLLSATARIANGESGVTVPRGGIRQLDTLALAFNNMAAQLAVAQETARDQQHLLEAKVAERTLQLQELAQVDPLTRLANRRHFFTLLDTAIENATRENRFVGVFFLDIDNFKSMNDSLGHEFGDHVLQTIAKRLSESTHSFGFAARLGGDEFTAVYESASSIEDIRIAGLQLIQAFEEPLLLEGRELIVSVSAGASVYPDHAPNAEALMRAADTALYEAKSIGRSQLALFTPALLEVATARFTTEQGLRRAIDRGEFELAFQPEVNLQTCEIEVVEALLRWRLPDGRYALPGEFLAVAEASGLILPINDWVLRRAVETAAHWHHGAWPSACVAINVSSRQLFDNSFVEQVQRLLKEYKLPPGCIEIELTENVLQTGSATIASLHRLRAHGIAIALDDFGTGFSSLASLEQLPLSRIKLDRSLIASIDTNPRSAAIARAIIQLCQGLGLSVTAEGIERPEQLAPLVGYPGLYAQGYLLAHPQPSDQLPAVLATLPTLTRALVRASIARLPESQLADNLPFVTATIKD